MAFSLAKLRGWTSTRACVHSMIRVSNWSNRWIDQLTTPAWWSTYQHPHRKVSASLITLLNSWEPNPVKKILLKIIQKIQKKTSLFVFFLSLNVQGQGLTNQVVCEQDTCKKPRVSNNRKTKLADSTGEVTTLSMYFLRD